MTEQEKNTNVTMGILMAVLDEQSKQMLPVLEQFRDHMQKQNENINKVIDVLNKMTVAIDILRGFVINAYAQSQMKSLEWATAAYNDYIKAYKEQVVEKVEN